MSPENLYRKLNRKAVVQEAKADHSSLEFLVLPDSENLKCELFDNDGNPLRVSVEEAIVVLVPRVQKKG